MIIPLEININKLTIGQIDQIQENYNYEITTKNDNIYLKIGEITINPKEIIEEKQWETQKVKQIPT